MAERMGLTTILNICSTCQGVMAQANYRLLADPDYLTEVNEELKPEGLEYTGRVVIKHPGLGCRGRIGHRKPQEARH